jgi:MFS family permease
LYATGAIAISVVPLLADYVHRESRGTCAAILVFMSSIGAVSSAFINFTILSSVDVNYKIYLQYGVISGIILVIGIAYTMLCLKNGNTYYSGG